MITFFCVMATLVCRLTVWYQSALIGSSDEEGSAGVLLIAEILSVMMVLLAVVVNR